MTAFKLPKDVDLSKLDDAQREQVAAELIRRAEKHEAEADKVNSQIQTLSAEFNALCDKSYHLRRLAFRVRDYRQAS